MSRPRGWCLRTTVVTIDAPIIMGILNVTPDSFSDGGLFVDPDLAVERAEALVRDGAHIVDVGGESTRPGADPVSPEEELRRAVPVVGRLAERGHIVSIDTTKPEVAHAALSAGAEIVNDVSGFRNPVMREVAAQHRAGVVVMHMLGDPRTMQIDPRYEDVVGEVSRYLAAQARLCEAAGIRSESICIDPGFGFGKNLEHNLELLDRIGELADLGYVVMAGTSRKRFIGSILGLEDPLARDFGTAVTVALAVERGISVFRVHDPSLSREAALVARAIVGARNTRRELSS